MFKRNRESILDALVAFMAPVMASVSPLATGAVSFRVWGICRGSVVDFRENMDIRGPQPVGSRAGVTNFSLYVARRMRRSGIGDNPGSRIARHAGGETKPAYR